ncbi:hypothetical protein JAAARDRAFT_204974 [Jaapia argillacea MUCL 33604]|uniref:Uncharacterized protein n=1 Tax=Jaapia argillacea MUCL 33604 TaxID=933084 RepID=A0A067Q2E6_9AGAM|nr:hypothetical protein JAAARDRAFT_204974 [Jaapia argillacea MUCL 33604]
MPRILSLALLSAVTIPVVFAGTSLYIPGFDPQPLSVSEIGAGSDGRTTWQVIGVPGTDGQVDFPGTATLIEGPNDAVITYSVAGLQLLESCSLSAGLAYCTAAGFGEGSSVAVTGTETATPISVEGGAATGAPQASGSITSVPTAASTGKTGSGFSSVSKTQTPGSSGAPAAATTAASSGGMKVGPVMCGGVAGLAMLALCFSYL